MQDDDDGRRGFKRAMALLDEYERHKTQKTTTGRFAGASPSLLIQMWETGQNEHGQKLSQFEAEALVEALGRMLGTLPPNKAMPQTEPPAVTTSTDEGDREASITIEEVAALLRTSKSTVKRLRNDPARGFPQPMYVTPRCMRWKRGDILDWKARQSKP